MNGCLNKHRFFASFLLSCEYPGIELLGHVLRVYELYKKFAKLISKVDVSFGNPIVMHEDSSC